MAEWLAFLSFIIAGVAGAYSWWAQRDYRRAFERLTDAQADGAEIKNLTDLLRMISDLQDQRAEDFKLLEETRKSLHQTQTALAEAQREIRELKTENVTLRHGVSILIGQIRKLNVAPAWTPDQGKGD